MYTPADAIQALQQFERLDDYQVEEIVGVIENQQAEIQQLKAMVEQCRGWF